MKRETRSQRLQPAGLTSKINSGENTNEGEYRDGCGRKTDKGISFHPFLLGYQFLEGNATGRNSRKVLARGP
jgi:hypothetical protein